MINKISKYSISITTSKRFDLFERTIKSFCNFCDDLHLIENIFHYDDSSSEDDREKMSDLLSLNFPKSNLIEKKFSPDEFPDGKRHCNIMSDWVYAVSTKSKYVFHLEDDWEFNDNFRISDLSDLIESDPSIAYVGVSQEMRDFPKDFIIERRDKFWKWYYDESRPLFDNLFLDTKIMEKSTSPGYWCNYINWPYFGFRPGLWDAEKLVGFEIMCNTDLPFEVDFAKRLSEKYVSYCADKSFCDHIGEISSYSLNNSLR